MFEMNINYKDFTLGYSIPLLEFNSNGFFASPFLILSELLLFLWHGSFFCWGKYFYLLE